MVIIPMKSGSTKDACVNNFSFLTSGSVEDGAANITLALKTFYAAVQTNWSPDVDSAKVFIKIYDRADPKPRPPRHEEVFGLGVTVGTTSLPHELALCCSFRGARVAGVPPARQRGRIFFGPLATSTVVGSTFTSTTLTNFANALNTLRTTTDGYPNVEWVVWSERTGPSGSGWHVTDGWVDNAVDVQRRRGVAPTVKTLWP